MEQALSEGLADKCTAQRPDLRETRFFYVSKSNLYIFLFCLWGKKGKIAFISLDCCEKKFVKSVK